MCCYLCGVSASLEIQTGLRPDGFLLPEGQTRCLSEGRCGHRQYVRIKFPPAVQLALRMRPLGHG